MTATERNRKALLLSEDSEAVRALAHALERRGFEVLTAPDGAFGVEALLDNLLTLDVVLVDDDLPGRDAASLLRLVRVAGGERDLAIVIRGEGLSPHARATLRALGADAIVSTADSAPRVAAVAAGAVVARARGVAAPLLRPALPALAAA